MSLNEKTSKYGNAIPKFFKFPTGISNFSRDQIEALAAGIMRQFLSNPKYDLCVLDREYLAFFYAAYGQDPGTWPTTFQLADLITSHFPGSNLSLQGEQSDYKFELKFQGHTLLTLQNKQIKCITAESAEEWEGQIEGDFFTIGHYLLQHFADIGYTVYEPRRPFELGILPNEPRVLASTKGENK